LEALEELCGAPVEMVSTGPERHATIEDIGTSGKSVLDKWFGTSKKSPAVSKNVSIIDERERTP
jgi:hypothetical protein